jgi:Fic family protein
VRFCVDAHVEQARRRLEQSLFRGVDRASYAAEADVSPQTASNDLRRLIDAGFVVQRGKGRSTRYLASDTAREDLQRRTAERAAQR